MTPSNSDAAGPEHGWSSFSARPLLPGHLLAAGPLLSRQAGTQRRRRKQDVAGEHGPVCLYPIHAMADGALLGAQAVDGREMLTLSAGSNVVAWQGGRSASWLLHLACAEASMWHSGPSRRTGLMVCVRLPVGVAYDAVLAEQAQAALARSSLPPPQLEVGVDAARLRSLDDDATLALSALRKLGIGIALDEVGAGPLAARALRRIPFTCLRLHACMVAHLDLSRDARRAVADTVALARGVGAYVIATGVRTALQRDILADLGCEGAQGPQCGPPMHARAFRAALAALPDD